MYIPKAFEMHDAGSLADFIKQHSFGLLVSYAGLQPEATHVPFFYDSTHQVLLTHLAKNNPQWRNIQGQRVMVVFSGPHCYVSPSWYGFPDSVPTWNYVAVHVTGNCEVVHEDTELAQLLENIVKFYEPESTLPGRSNEAFYQGMMKEIVGLRIRVEKIEGAAKLSQNKPIAVQERVIERLKSLNDADSLAVAGLMREQLSGKKN